MSFAASATATFDLDEQDNETDALLYYDESKKSGIFSKLTSPRAGKSEEKKQRKPKVSQSSWNGTACIYI